MASLYEIEQAILDCIDLETGEIVDTERLNELQIEKDTKLENVALWIKNLTSDAAAYKAEKDAFAEREKQAKAKVDGLKKYLSDALGGQKMTTSRVAITFRKSESVEIPDETAVPKKYLVKKIELKPDKTAIKELLKSGQRVKGCELIEKQNIQIK